jgi:hypothetical protein
MKWIHFFQGIILEPSLCSPEQFLIGKKWLQLAQSPSTAEFSSTLSISQFNSHRILLELWQVRPADQQLLGEILDYFQKIADEGEPEDAPNFKDRDYRLPSMDTPSAFRSSIFNLFMWEFFCHTDDGDGVGLFLTTLHDVRREAAIYMACSRLARQCFGPHLGNGHRWDGPSLGAFHYLRAITNYDPHRYVKVLV